MTSTAVFPGTASASALLVPSSGTPFRGPFSRRGTRAPAVLTKSVAPLGRRSSPVCESRPNRHCLFQAVAHRSGRRGSDRSRHTQSTARPTRKPMAFPHRTVLGNRPCPCSFRAAPHCLFQAVAHGFGSRPAEQGHPGACSRGGSAPSCTLLMPYGRTTTSCRPTSWSRGNPNTIPRAGAPASAMGTRRCAAACSKQWRTHSFPAVKRHASESQVETACVQLPQPACPAGVRVLAARRMSHPIAVDPGR